MSRRIAFSALLLIAACGAPSVRVARITPEGVAGATEPIEVRFDRQVVHAAAVGQPYQGAPLLEITPELPGRYEWLGIDRLAFVPLAPFARNTTYKVRVRPEALGPGLVLAGRTEATFNTPLFTVLTVEPLYAGNTVRANIELSEPVKPDDARAKIVFTTAGGEPIPATLETTGPSRVLAFALQALPGGAKPAGIQVVVDGTLAPASGGQPLGARVVRSLELLPPPKLAVENVYPQQSGDAYSLMIRFNADVDGQSAKGALRIEPEPAELSVTDGYRSIYVNGRFEPETQYQVVLRKGLLARNGSTLEEDVTLPVAIGPLEPSASFESEGNYLMRGGKRALSIRTVNMKSASVRVEKVFENNLVHALPEYGERYGEVGTLGVLLFEGTVPIAEKRNQPVVTSIRFGDLDVEPRRGLYRVRVRDEESSWVYADKWLLATDLAITAKVWRDSVRVQVVSLETLQPVEGAEVALISQQNQPIGRARTAADGVAVHPLGAAQKKEPLALITVKKGDDFSYLALAGTRVSLDDFEVGGDGEAAAPYDAYLFSDRGVYRPGEKVSFAVIVRDEALRPPPAFPYTVEVRDPEWRLFRTLRGSTADDGGKSLSFDTAQDSPTGAYVIRVLSASGEELGRLAVKVEDFMPDRIKVEVKAVGAAGASLADGVPMTIDAAYLFGPKASGLRVEKRCRFGETGVGYPGFTFAAADPDAPRAPIDTVEELGEGKLDEQGHAEATCTLSPAEPPRGPVRASLIATVFESGGRSVTGVASTVLHLHDAYPGLRRAGGDRWAVAGQPAGVELIVVGRDAKPVAGVAVKAAIKAVEYRTILKMVEGRYRYASERVVTPVREVSVTSGEKPVPIAFTPDKPGEYTVTAAAGEGGADTTISFWASGRGEAAWDMSKPGQVALTLDKEAYAPGDVARVMVRAPFEGRVYLTIERDRVLASRAIDLSGNTGSAEIPITAEMTPNAYVFAELVRSPRSLEKQAPMRAVGIAPFGVRSDRHRLPLSLTAPDEMRPNGPLEVRLQSAPGARVVVAAVDEGILRITDHPSPDPFAYFTRKRRLGVTTHDLFDQLLPEVAGRTTSIVRSGGDDAVRAKHLNPVSVRRVKPVALWSGIVVMGADGRGLVRFDVPELEGSLRVMAVAFSGERFGAAEKEMKVRDPIVLTPTLPRFVGPLDAFEVPVEVFNGTGKLAEVTVRIAVEGRIKVEGGAERTLALASGGKARATFALRADEVIGAAKVTVGATGAGISTRSETELAIRPASTTVTEGTTLLLRAGTPATYHVPKGFIPGTGRVRVSVGPGPVAQYGAALAYLLQYPYGCVEQTTSRAFPLLYFSDLAWAAPHLDAAPFVAAAIARIASMSMPGGGFAYWPGASAAYPWFSVYATHFLVEAQKAGHAVDPALIALQLDHLARIAADVPLPAYGSERADARTQAYALYVLALAGKPNTSAAIHAADRVKLALASSDRAWADADTRALISGALLLSGERSRAEAFTGADVPLAQPGPRSAFWSEARADALVLSVLADVAPDHRSVPILIEKLARQARPGRWGNTQENAFALMALGKIERRIGRGGYEASLLAGGKVVASFSSARAETIERAAEDWSELSLSVKGEGAAFASIQVEGIRAAPQPAESHGIEVRRTYLSSAGTPLDLAAIPQGELVIGKLEVTTPAGARVDQAAVVDLLPAGIELENPRLRETPETAWMIDRAVPQFIDIRDDRLIFFADLPAGSTTVYYYAARAVSPGEFVLPPVHAEAMYDPLTFARTAAGRVSVKAR